MKFQEYLLSLNQLAEKYPPILDLEVIYSRDSEGNGYQRVYYHPSLGVTNGLETDCFDFECLENPENQVEIKTDDTGKKVVTARNTKTGTQQLIQVICLN